MKRISKWTGAWVLVGLAMAATAGSQPATSQPAPSAVPLPQVNNAVLTELAAQVVLVHDVPGIGISVVTKEGLHAFGVAGVRRSGSPDRMTTEDVFHIGSCAKMMTATLLLRLEQQGKLRLSSTLPELFPEVQVAPALQKVTLADLLRHRAGFPSQLDMQQLAFFRVGANDPAGSRAKLAERVLTANPDGEVGRFAYSNVGYALAGHVAERVTGMPFETLIQRELFAPLGVTTAGFGAPGVAGKIEQPFGHRGAAMPVDIGPFADNPIGMSPAGTIYLSLRDWSRFVAVLLGGGPDGFLDSARLAELTLPPPGTQAGNETNPRYALGIGITEVRGQTAYSHAGSNTAWFAQVLIIPTHEIGGRKVEGWAILAATNHGGDPGEKATTEVLKELTALSGQ
jgi:CubicO group peptidase (beta-lactamase class C family)